MPTRGFALFAGAVLMALLASHGAAQGLSGLRVGPRFDGSALEAQWISPSTLAQLSRAAGGVPMGIELAAGPRPRFRPWLTLSGRSLGQALNLLAASDPGYEWREMNGVIVFRPRDAWADPAHRLNTEVDAVYLKNIRGRDVLTMTARILGARQTQIGSLADTTRFTIDAPPGTLLQLLNESVRSHGSMVWSLDASHPAGVEPRDPPHDMNFSLFAGGNGSGLGIPADGVTLPVALTPTPIPVPNNRWSRALERVVPLNTDGKPLAVRGSAGFAYRLSELVGVPMGIVRVVGRESDTRERVPVSGMRLRDALDVVTRLSPVYEWYEDNGVIIFQPVGGWWEADNPLERPVEGTHIRDTPTGDAVSLIVSRLGGPPPTLGLPFGDDRRVSLNMPGGNGRDLLNAMVRAHGNMSWYLRPLPEEERQERSVRYAVSFRVFFEAGYTGFSIP